MSDATSILPIRWLDATRFGAKVLRNGETPWAEPAQMGPFLRELQGYLGLAPMQLDLGYALETASVGRAEARLDDPAFRSMLDSAIASTVASAAGAPVVLAIPGPGCLAGTPDEDRMDDIALLLTDLLRASFVPGIALLAIDETLVDGLDFLAPLRNVTGDYGIPLVVRAPADFAGDIPASVADRVYQRVDVADLMAETTVPGYAELSADTTPEDALALAASLRG